MCRVSDLAPAPPTVGEGPGTAYAGPSEWQLLPSMELHKKVIRRSDGTVSIAAHTEPLTVLHGPHLRLNEGFYRLRVQCEVETRADRCILSSASRSLHRTGFTEAGEISQPMSCAWGRRRYNSRCRQASPRITISMRHLNSASCIYATRT
jgi:hypothetical protein